MVTQLEVECRAALPILVTGAARLGVSLDAHQQDQFVDYAVYLLETNRRFNLTAIRSPADVMLVLFLDTLVLRASLDRYLPRDGAHLRAVDVGSGAGLPGIPLAILDPGWNIVLVESIGKKAKFLRDAVERLGLPKVEVLQDRAETLGRQPRLRDSFDLVVARAVAALPSLIELCAPLARKGAVLAFPKSGAVQEEIASARRAASALATASLEVLNVPEELDLGEGRAVVLYRKEGPTPPRYPRNVGLATSQPIASRVSSPAKKTPRVQAKQRRSASRPPPGGA